jgi:DNA-binding response OmpR family regulator
MSAFGSDIVAQAGTVLIVDDDVISRQFLADALGQMADIKVYAFERGADLLEAARWRRPDLIITDLEMPEVGGLDIIKGMKESGYEPAVPIIVVTASTSREVRRQALQEGAADFLAKPLDPSEIRARCRNLVNLSRAQVALHGRADWLSAEVQLATATVVAREHETILRLASTGTGKLARTSSGSGSFRASSRPDFHSATWSRMRSIARPRCTTWASWALPTTSFGSRRDSVRRSSPRCSVTR